jgi:hypothetical protein
MLLFLKLTATIVGLSLVIPLVVAAGTGSWKHGWFAWRSWWRYMAVLVLIGGGLGLIGHLAGA